jgi:hypothetical protein
LTLDQPAGRQDTGKALTSIAIRAGSNAKRRLEETGMTDYRRKSHSAFRPRINLGQDYELRYWSTKYGVSPEQLKEVVEKVGDSVADVEKELARCRS